MDRNDDRESTFDQAERWMARLNAHDCSAADRRAFETWRTGDPAHAAAYAESERLWSELAALADDGEVAGWRYQARVAARNSEASRFAARRRYGWAVAASLFVGALFAGYFALRAPADVAVAALPVVTHYATKPGEIRHVVLPDGSRLTLNVNTALDASVGPHARVVHLTRGEAVFDVVHEPQRSFTVYAAGNTIRDIGTRFDVNVAGSRTSITVVEGVVSVARKGQAATLALGDQLVSGEGEWSRRSIDPSVAVGWTQGKLVFRDTPLGEAVAQANRYGPGHLVIVDPTLEKLPISGDFRIGQTASLVRALQAAFRIHARFDKASGETLLSRR